MSEVLFSSGTQAILDRYHQFLFENQALVLEIEYKILSPSDQMKYILVEHLKIEEKVASAVVLEFNTVTKRELGL
jgi:23S rRNA C2498 (ribose-2'-O)-methylase RlmM